MLINDLKAARQSKGLSRAALAHALGVDAQTIKRLESGIGTMPTLISVMTMLDYHLSNLARGNDLPSQLRQRRMNLRLSLDEVARRAQISRATIAALEAGRGSVRSALRVIDAIAPQARQRQPSRAHWTPDPRGDRDHQFTPPAFMEAVYEAFGEVDLDPCGHAESPVRAKRRILLNEGGDGLRDNWSGRLVFMNCPYSALLKWLRRADEQWSNGNVETVVALVPARTDSAWFHERLIGIADIYMMKGRLRFLTVQGRGNQAPFPLMVVLFGAQRDQRDRFAELIPGFWLRS